MLTCTTHPFGEYHFRVYKSPNCKNRVLVFYDNTMKLYKVQEGGLTIGIKIPEDFIMPFCDKLEQLILNQENEVCFIKSKDDISSDRIDIMRDDYEIKVIGFGKYSYYKDTKGISGNEMFWKAVIEDLRAYITGTHFSKMKTKIYKYTNLSFLPPTKITSFQKAMFKPRTK